ncbi:hypothetical protein SAMN02910413_1681 [Pseudobutyrivibrio sp. C4]|uniref:hypothetical protein n=1 Tax=Pseudobutyrivibrio sp. C4 TaxID=1520803 RepID=UPI0008CEFDF9|nr:hypothetical protein [Pseudobutyrivibrio sp. C4]SET05842.1 hypothetical protein SAMN02910413_1681 [Pseudobutyrivibrio sp. C4]
MNERHEGQLKLAHQLYDDRDLKQELLWQREFLDTGYLSYQQVCFNKWIFDECLKRLEERKVGKWIKVTETEFGIGYQCSECGRFILTESIDGRKLEDFPYCHCGAVMRGNENE